MKRKLVNVTRNGAVVITSAVVADNFLQRLCGLMFRPAIGVDEAMVFYNAGGIHCFFMRFSLDLVFLNKEMKVIKIFSQVKPWRMVFCPGSYLTIELLGGNADRKFSLGDKIEVI